MAEADRRAIHQFFTLDFVYFHKAKLLALVGYRYPKANNFFKKHVGFQNCCDQDYERDAWEGIKFFETIWDECNTMTPEEVLAYENKDCIDYTLEKIVEMLDYHKRSIAYEKIYDCLHLDDWLYGKSDETFTRFSMNVITSQEMQWKAEQYANVLLK